MSVKSMCWFAFGILLCASVLKWEEGLSDRGVKPTLIAQFAKIETAVTSVLPLDEDKDAKEVFKGVYSRLNFKPRKTLIDGREELVTFLLNPDFNRWVELRSRRTFNAPLIGAIVYGETNTMVVYYSDRNVKTIHYGARISFNVSSNECWNSSVL